MERKNQPSIVFIFVNVQKRQVLLERRAPASSYAGQLIYPGGKVEGSEVHNFEEALRREIMEELGVIPVNFQTLPTPEKIVGETGRLLNPYIITSWQGIIPKNVLDKGNPLIWQDIETADSPFESFKKLTLAVKRFLLDNYDSYLT